MVELLLGACPSLGLTLSLFVQGSHSLYRLWGPGVGAHASTWGLQSRSYSSFAPSPCGALEGSPFWLLMAPPQEAFQGSGNGQVSGGESAALAGLMLSLPAPA